VGLNEALLVEWTFGAHYNSLEGLVVLYYLVVQPIALEVPLLECFQRMFGLTGVCEPHEVVAVLVLPPVLGRDRNLL